LRFNFVSGGAALLVSASLAACSGANPSTLPAASQQAAPLRQHVSGIVPIHGFRMDDGNFGGSCPTSTGSAYIYCYYVQPGTTFSQEWEEETPSGGVEPGNWHWRKAHVFNVATGAQTNKIRNLGWSPTPGNPSTNTVSVSAVVAPTGGTVGYTFNISVCSNNSPHGPGYCDTPNAVGIVVLPPTTSGS
jgi:hypothetical protein